MRKLTVLAFVGLLTLACSGATTPSQADIECALPADANACESCLHATCEDECRACVDDPSCFACTDSENPPPDCLSNPGVGALVGCVLGNCVEECTKEPSRKKRQRVGKGRDGKGKKGGKNDR
jgi:hypothetical protein